MSMEYCTYLTIYRGTKLPPFYIGRSTVVKVKNGYHGSVSSKRYREIWISELELNPHLFETKILTIHSTKKEAADKEEYFHKKHQVHKNPLYINQATAAGTFHANVKGKNNPMYGSCRSGNLNPMYGKTHDEVSRKKMSLSGKGKHSQPKTELFKQTLSEYYSGKTYEERFGKERADEIKAKQRKPKSAQHIQNVKAHPYHSNRPKFECPHCGKSATKVNLNRWHGNNCRTLKILSDPS